MLPVVAFGWTTELLICRFYHGWFATWLPKEACLEALGIQWGSSREVLWVKSPLGQDLRGTQRRHNWLKVPKVKLKIDFSSCTSRFLECARFVWTAFCVFFLGGCGLLLWCRDALSPKVSKDDQVAAG